MEFDWGLIHQQAFKEMKNLIAHNIILAYTNFELFFQLYTNINYYQLCAVIITSYVQCQ